MHNAMIALMVRFIASKPDYVSVRRKKECFGMDKSVNNVFSQVISTLLIKNVNSAQKTQYFIIKMGNANNALSQSHFLTVSFANNVVRINFGIKPQKVVRNVV
jgi:hypothetical protein